MTELKIRKALETETEMLSDLAQRSFWETYRTESKLENKYLRKYISSAFSSEQIRSDLDNKNTIYFVAERKNKPIGYAKLIIGSSRKEVSGKRPVEISRIYFIRECWGSGFGKLLLDECVRYAKVNNCDVIWLSVWKYNDRAIGFYIKHGFQKVGEHIFDLASSPQIDDVMERVL